MQLLYLLVPLLSFVLVPDCLAIIVYPYNASSHRVTRTPISCYKSHLYVSPISNESCELGTLTCHEHVYRLKGDGHLTYTAGCGGRIRSRSSFDAPLEESIINCRGHLCNSELLKQLREKGRICKQEKASRVLGNNSVACSSGEFLCFFEKSNSKVPFYNAGCGHCPPYTRQCTVCDAIGNCETADGGAIKFSDSSMLADSATPALVVNSVLMAVALIFGVGVGVGVGLER